METKKEIRKQILQKRDALSDLERQQKSEEIVQKVIASEVFQNSDVFLLFSLHFICFICFCYIALYFIITHCY